MLTNDEYLQERMKDYDPAKATPSSRYKPGYSIQNRK